MLEEGTGAPSADPAVCAEILTKVRQLAGIAESQACGRKSNCLRGSCRRPGMRVERALLSGP